MWGLELMQIILSAKDADPLFDLSQAIRSNTQAVLSPKQREASLQELATAYYHRHQDKLSFVSCKDFVAYASNNNPNPATEQSVFDLKVSHPEMFQEITTVKAFIDRGFGTTLGRSGNVNYGRDPDSEMWTIPYKASNNPNIGSEFDDDIEKIAFTLQDYLQNGVTYSQVSQILGRLRVRALKELRDSDPENLISINETQSGKEFQEFLKEIGQEGKGRFNLSIMDHPKHLQALVELINGTPEARLAFCHTQVVKKMKSFPTQIHSVSTDVADIVRNFGGFTGTPWNLHTYHDKIHAEKNLGVDGSTWALLLSREVPIHTFHFDAEKPIESLTEQLDIGGRYQAVIDAGAYLRGTDNVDFIDKCLEQAKAKGKTVQGAIFFNDDGRIVKKTGVEKESLPNESAPETDKMKTITLYDQSHTVGADIKQGKTARAVVTIGENTFIRDLFQAVWRMRELHLQQRVDLAVSDKLRDRILAGADRELTLEDILRFCIINEATREAEDNYRAEKEKIQGAARRFAIHQTTDIVVDGASDEAISQIAHALVTEKGNFLVKTRPREEMFDQYGRLKKLESPADILERSKVTEKEQCGQLANLLREISPKAAEAFTALGEEIAIRAPIPAAWCPKEINSSHQEGGEIEVEAQASIEQENAMEIQAETEQEVELELEIITERRLMRVQNAQGGHGDVSPLQVEQVQTLVEEGRSDSNHYRKLADSVDFFDPEINISCMFERNLSQSFKGNINPLAVFYSQRKPTKQVLIAKHEDRWTALVPSIHESYAACRDYIKKAQSETQIVQVAISPSKAHLIYKNGSDRSAALPFSDESDRNQFYRLYSQVKFFNGETEYTAEEREALKTWIIEKGDQKLKEYFEMNILPSKPKRISDAYPKSSLAALFAEIASLPQTVYP